MPMIITPCTAGPVAQPPRPQQPQQPAEPADVFETGFRRMAQQWGGITGLLAGGGTSALLAVGASQLAGPAPAAVTVGVLAGGAVLGAVIGHELAGEVSDAAAERFESSPRLARAVVALALPAALAAGLLLAI